VFNKDEIKQMFSKLVDRAVLDAQEKHYEMDDFAQYNINVRYVPSDPYRGVETGTFSIRYTEPRKNTITIRRPKK
jgi:hypothetical protein